MAYTLSTTKGFIKSTEILAQLDRNIPLQNAWACEIEKIEAEGIRYSNQDFDILSGAHSSIGKSEVPNYQRAWVDQYRKPQ